MSSITKATITFKSVTNIDHPDHIIIPQMFTEREVWNWSDPKEVMWVDIWKVDNGNGMTSQEIATWVAHMSQIHTIINIMAQIDSDHSIMISDGDGMGCTRFCNDGDGSVEVCFGSGCEIQMGETWSDANIVATVTNIMDFNGDWWEDVSDHPFHNQKK